MSVDKRSRAYVATLRYGILFKKVDLADLPHRLPLNERQYTAVAGASAEGAQAQKEIRGWLKTNEVVCALVEVDPRPLETMRLELLGAVERGEMDVFAASAALQRDKHADLYSGSALAFRTEAELLAYKMRWC